MPGAPIVSRSYSNAPPFLPLFIFGRAEAWRELTLGIDRLYFDYLASAASTYSMPACATATVPPRHSGDGSMLDYYAESIDISLAKLATRYGGFKPLVTITMTV